MANRSSAVWARESRRYTSSGRCRPSLRSSTAAMACLAISPVIRKARFQVSRTMPSPPSSMRKDALDLLHHFLSLMTIERGTQSGMSTWRKRLYIGLSHNAASPAANSGLPVERTVVMGSRVEL